MANNSIDLKPLTGLRGIAAWLVVFYHVRSGMGGYTSENLMGVMAKGYLAVDLFFLLSGFVMWLTYSQRFADAGYRYSTDFLLRRVARIWPLHAVILLLTCIFVLALALTGRPYAQGYPVGELPLHIVLMQNWGFTDDLKWNHPAWSISTEMAAYLIFPLLVLLLRPSRFNDIMLLIMIGLGAAAIHQFFSLQGYTTIGADIAKAGLFRCIIQFAMGMFICILWHRWRGQILKKALPCAVTASAIFILALTGWMPETFAAPLGFSFFLLAFTLTAEWKGNPLGHPILHYLGEVSYATYLSHFMLYVFFKIIFIEDAAAVPPAMFALFLLIVLAVSVLLYHMVEKPAQRWINNLGKRQKTVFA